MAIELDGGGNGSSRSRIGESEGWSSYDACIVAGVGHLLEKRDCSINRSVRAKRSRSRLKRVMMSSSFCSMTLAWLQVGR